MTDRARHKETKHGSSYTGDRAQALDDFNVVLREVFGPRT
jgi:hypothetical protein